MFIYWLVFIKMIGVPRPTILVPSNGRHWLADGIEKEVFKHSLVDLTLISIVPTKIMIIINAKYWMIAEVWIRPVRWEDSLLQALGAHIIEKLVVRCYKRVKV